jgi:hypothetical protein
MSGARERPDQGRAPPGVAPDGDKGCPRLGQLSRRRGPDAGGRAGEDDRLPLKTCHASMIDGTLQARKPALPQRAIADPGQRTTSLGLTWGCEPT